MLGSAEGWSDTHGAEVVWSEALPLREALEPSRPPPPDGPSSRPPPLEYLPPPPSRALWAKDRSVPLPLPRLSDSPPRLERPLPSLSYRSRSPRSRPPRLPERPPFCRLLPESPSMLDKSAGGAACAGTVAVGSPCPGGRVGSPPSHSGAYSQRDAILRAMR